MKTYVINHPHARQKPEALANLEALITALGLKIEIPAAGDRPLQGAAILIIHSDKFLRATIQVTDGSAPKLKKLKWLLIFDD
jgi:hypothetical protein